MLGVLLKALPKKTFKLKERGETINLVKNQKGSREDSLPKATGDLMFVHESDGQSVLEWFHVLFCCGWVTVPLQSFHIFTDRVCESCVVVASSWFAEVMVR